MVVATKGGYVDAEGGCAPTKGGCQPTEGGCISTKGSFMLQKVALRLLEVVVRLLKVAGNNVTEWLLKRPVSYLWWLCGCWLLKVTACAATKGCCVATQCDKVTTEGACPSYWIW